MKSFIVLITLFTSLSSFAGDMSCGFGKDNHFVNSTNVPLDEDNKGMIILTKGTNSYVVTFDGMFYRYIKSNSDQGGFEEKTVMPKDMSSLKLSVIVDGIWCHIND